MICNSILDAIGHTPMIRLNRMNKPGNAEILVKFEGLNAGGSIKTRTAYNMIRQAEKKQNWNAAFLVGGIWVLAVYALQMMTDHEEQAWGTMSIMFWMLFGNALRPAIRACKKGGGIEIVPMVLFLLLAVLWSVRYILYLFG